MDLRAARTVDPRQLLSRSDFSLFQGRTLRGWPVATIKGGHIAAWNGQLTDDSSGARCWSTDPPAEQKRKNVMEMTDISPKICQAISR